MTAAANVPKLLIVEDNPGDVFLIEELLDSGDGPGFDLVQAGNLADGIRCLENSDIDLLLLDLRLPDSQHLETLARARAVAPDVPIIVLTGDRDDQLPLAAVRDGAQDYLVKGTFDGELLTRTIRYAMERMRNSKALRESERRYKRLYERVEAGVFELNLEGKLISANPALVRMLGYENENELLALDLASQVFSQPSDYENWFRVLSQEGQTIQSQHRLKCSDGRQIVVLGNCHGVRGGHDHFVGYQGIFSDITEVHELSEQLSYEASHDALTNLANRRMFELQLNEVVDRIRCEDATYALCYLDLDQFKIINDTCGHAAGDELLRQLSAVLDAGIPGKAILARLGGDEFGLLHEVDDREHALVEAERLVQIVRDFRFAWGERVFEVSVSIGVVLLEASVLDVDEALAAADAACFTAKDDGGGRVHFGQPGDETLERRIGEMQWAIRVKEAVREDRFALFHQPIASVSDRVGQPTRFEVLLRLIDDSLGSLTGPSHFLPAVERYNLGSTLDRWVINSVLTWLERYAGSLGEFLCSINLSGQSVGDPEFLRFLEERLNSSSVAAQSLCLEITESAAIRNLGAAKKLIERIRSRGCRFSLDDFGSGLSSFAYLKNLDVDYIKIDGMFIREITTDAVDRATVKAIAEIAREMGKQTIAEFVEDGDSVAVLRGLGVNYVQGYAVGKPAPIERLLEVPPERSRAIGIR